MVFINIGYKLLLENEDAVRLAVSPLNLLIDDANFDDRRIVKLLQAYSHPVVFSLTLELLLQANRNKALQKKLYLLYCFSVANRCLFNGLPVIQSGAANQNTGGLVQYFHEQGEAGRVLLFERDDNMPGQVEFATMTVDMLANCSKDEWLDHCARYNFIFITTGQTSIFADWVARCKVIQGYIFAAPIASGMLLEIKVKQRQLLQEKLALQARSQLYLDFLSISKKVVYQENTDLRNWYKQEYEALPLWYKKVGHLLKVFMGKRSLKSLFR